MKKLLTVRAFVIFIVACALTYYLEHAIEDITHDENRGTTSQSIFDARGVYENLIGTWPRRLVPRYTVLVKIDKTAQTMNINGAVRYIKDPFAIGLTNVCEQRGMMARLLLSIARQEPAVIVVDKYFTAGTCENNPKGTQALQQAVAEISQRMPIVVGLRVDRKRPKPPTQDWHPLIEPLDFPGSGRFAEAILNMDLDTRRLAFGWKVAKEDTKPGYTRTLSLETALLYDALLFQKHSSLEQMVHAATRPYVSIMEGNRFKWYFAGDFFCGGGEPQALHESWCATRNGDVGSLTYLRGRIVLIGEDDLDNDGHHTVIGFVPGMLLHANYIEALLDERYFRPAPPWVNYLIGFFFFVAIELSLMARNPLVCLLWVGVSIAVTLVLLSLIVRYLGVYVNPVTFSTLVLALTMISWMRERIMKKAEVSHE
jgi:CHASE2 domain-containing sensor protein